MPSLTVTTGSPDRRLAKPADLVLRDSSITTAVARDFIDQASARAAGAAGLGFACVSREVFESLKGTVRKFSRDGLTEAENDELYDYFSPADHQDVWCGEDFAFCLRAKAAGYAIELDESARLTHHAGRVAFSNR